jgi:hypothetical protein
VPKTVFYAFAWLVHVFEMLFVFID